MDNMDSLISTGFGAKYLVPIFLISSWLSNNHFKRDMSQQELTVSPSLQTFPYSVGGTRVRKLPRFLPLLTLHTQVITKS